MVLAKAMSIYSVFSGVGAEFLSSSYLHKKRENVNTPVIIILPVKKSNSFNNHRHCRNPRSSKRKVRAWDKRRKVIVGNTMRRVSLVPKRYRRHQYVLLLMSLL
ncbi:hypothetical protein BC941DRAFT_412943 [Chlamydoabsidia padenii]|nr:hypothetical protein BC941DRAFT_412943 [Chlamydoabsidia padenii]